MLLSVPCTGAIARLGARSATALLAGPSMSQILEFSTNEPTSSSSSALLSHARPQYPAVAGLGLLYRRYAAAAAGDASPPGGSGGEEDDPAAIERFRTANNFRRRPDGRVLLWGRGGGAWMEAKLDGYVEGSLLLQRPEDGSIFYLVSEDLKQIDLSNDQLVAQLFKEGGWESVMQPLYSQAPEGGLKHVRMTPAQFRSIFTVLKEAPLPPTAPGGGEGQQAA